MMEDRLRKLEERQGFAEHDLEQVSRQVFHLLGEIDRLHKRVTAMEQKMRAADAEAQVESSPDEVHE